MVAGLLTGCGREAAEAPPAPVPVVVAPVRFEVLPRPVQGRGTVHPLRQAGLSLGASGRLAQVNAIAGQRVDSGAVLAILDKTALAADLSQAEFQLAEARRSLDKARKLYAGKPNRAAQLRKFEQETALCREVADGCRAALKRTALAAPFTGRMVSCFAAAGDSVTPGKILMVLAQVEPQARAWLPLSEKEYYHLETGDSAVVSPAGQSSIRLRGRVVSRDRSGGLTAPCRAEVLFDNPGALVTVGASVDVEIASTYEEKALLIPLSAVISSAERPPSVFVADPASRFAQRRYLKLGSRRDRDVVVEEGLAGEDRVVVFGQDRLSDGARIVVSELAPADKAGDFSRK
ncbi:MAG: efflux RND transporter periplasmic adaptor subunit [Candidatus Zixiibacteriota bacterium]|nr:MAG: efflux RND transporter periplasmic adaptor subunit [candidate division Zixibacteria bacterium]